jgi:hypothetical protein
MDTTSKLLHVHGDVTSEVNELEIHRVTNAYKVIATDGGPIAVSSNPDWDDDCSLAGSTVTCIHDLGGGAEALLPFEAEVDLGGGNDTLFFEDPNMFGPVTGETVEGGTGNDWIKGGTGDDRLWGDAGADQLDGRAGSDQVDGGDDNDDVTGGDGADFLFGGRGGDGFSDLGTSGTDTLFYNSETGLNRTGGVTLTLDHGTGGNDGGVDDGPAGSRDTIGPGIDRVNGTMFDDVMTGSAANETLSGSDGTDTLEGGTGSDTFIGGNGNDILKARDGVSDADVNCDSSSGNAGTADSAEVDAASVDATVQHCETVDRPSTGGTDPGGGTTDPGGGGTTPTDPTDPADPTDPGDPAEPGFVTRTCPTELNLYLRADYDVDKAAAGKMKLQVSAPVPGLQFMAVLSKGPAEDEKQSIGEVANVTANSVGTHTLKLGINGANRSQYVGKTREVTVNVYVTASGCPWLAIAHTVQLAPKPNASAGRHINASTSQRGSGAVPCFRIPMGAAGVLDCSAPVTKAVNCGGDNYSNFAKLPGTKVHATADCIKWPQNRLGYGVSEGIAKMNGLTIEPIGKGSNVWWDQKKFEFGVNGRAKISFTIETASGKKIEVPIYEASGSKTWNLRANELLAQRHQFGGSANIAGFKIAADLSLKLIEGGANATASLKLPEQFGGVQAEIDLDVTWDGIVYLNKAKAEVPELNAFGFTLRKFLLEYKQSKDPIDGSPHESWFGQARVLLPAMNGGSRPTFDLAMRWEDGNFVHGAIVGEQLKQAFGNSIIALDKVSGEITLKGRPTVSLGATVLFGPNVLPTSPTELGRVVVGLTYEAPEGKQPGTFWGSIKGAFSIWQLFPGQGLSADFAFRYSTDGYFRMKGTTGINFGGGSVNGIIGVTISPENFEGLGVVDVKIGSLEGAGSMIFNTEGATACVTVGPVRGGLRFDWQTKKLDTLGGSCGVAPFRKLIWLKSPGVRPAQADTATFNVPAGKKRLVLKLVGTTAPPNVTLVSPSGKRLAPVTQVATDKASYWLVDKPEGGTWRFDGLRASTLASAEFANEASRPTVDAEVKRAGDKMEVDYKVSALAAGETLYLYEKAGDSRFFLRKVSGSGKFTFKPEDIQVRPRELIAVTTRGGIPTGDEMQVARFKGFPAPSPTALFGEIKGKRKGKNVLLTWGPSGGADGYAVHLTLGDGRRESHLVKGQNNRKLTVKDVDKDISLKVTIYGWNEDFEFSRPTTVRFKGKKPDPPRKPPTKLKDPDEVGLVEVGVSDIQLAE